MRKISVILLLAIGIVSCTDLENSNPYKATLHTVIVQAVYPSGSAGCVRAGVAVTFENTALDARYRIETDANGMAKAKLPEGVYRIAVSDVGDEFVFNGSLDKVKVNDGTIVEVNLVKSKVGKLIIKEIYCGGCMKYPEQGTYQADQYIIIHNNYHSVQYLDSLCFGSLFPYNSNASNAFLSKDEATGEYSLPEYLPIGQAVWQFGGNGTSFPLQPGEDAVLCLRGAIDHSASYPLSVDLNREGYFVCYNSTYFTNTSYHPAPGNNISQDHILDVVIKLGQANAYTFSINSPAVVLFRAPAGMSMEEYVNESGNVIQVPGSSVDKVVTLTPDMVVDAVEVFNGSTSSNTKRLLPSLDAGYVTLSETFQSHTLMRYRDEDLSKALDYEVLKDTNNSTNDFYESQTQSLHEDR